MLEPTKRMAFKNFLFHLSWSRTFKPATAPGKMSRLQAAPASSSSATLYTVGVDEKLHKMKYKFQSP